MVHINSENLLSLPQAAKYVTDKFGDRRGGRALHVSTLHRWTTRGIRGIRLEVAQIGGTRATSVEALSRFFDRLGGGEEAAPPSCSPSPRGRQNSRAAAADRFLEKSAKI
jgi:hypothetical protein